MTIHQTGNPMRMSTTSQTTALIVVAIIVHTSPSLQLETDKITLLVPPLLSTASSKQFIVPPTLPPWLRARTKLISQDGVTTKSPIIIQPPTLHPARQSSSSTQTKNGPNLLPSQPNPPTIHQHKDLSTSSNSRKDDTTTPGLGQWPLPEKTPNGVTPTSVSNPSDEAAKQIPSNPPGLSNVLDTMEQALLSSLHLNLGGDPIPKRPAGLICYDDTPRIMNLDVPCPHGADGPRHDDVTMKQLTVMLRDQGGNILRGYATLEPPDHLKGFNLSDINNSDWMTMNNSYLGYRLQKDLNEQGDRVHEMIQKMRGVIATGSLRSITNMAKTLLRTLMSTPTFNICYTDLHERVRNDSRVFNQDEACLELFQITENLISLNVKVHEMSNSGEGPGNVYISSSGDLNVDSEIADMFRSSNLTERDIDELYTKLEDLKKTSFEVSHLHGKLKSAINSFQGIVSGLQKKFLEALQEFEVDLDANLTKGADVMGLMNQTHLNEVNSSENSTEKIPPSATSAFPPGLELFHGDVVTKAAESNRGQSNGTTSGHYQKNVSKDNEVPFVEPGSENSTESANQSRKPTVEVLTTTENSIRNNSRANGEEIGVDFPTNRNNGSSIKDSVLKEKLIIAQFFTSLAAELEKLNELVGADNSTTIEKDEHLENMTAMYKLRRRTRRDVAGFNIAHDTCEYQGGAINGTNYLSLCSSCVHTTVLDTDYFPRFLTEKLCIDGTSTSPSLRKGCLHQPGAKGRGAAGGVCQQQEFHIVLLKREPGMCMKIHHKGQDIVIDKWKPITHPLRIGCQCVVDQNSQFAKYTTIP